MSSVCYLGDVVYFDFSQRHIFRQKNTHTHTSDYVYIYTYTGLSKKMDGIWNRYNLKSTGRIYTFGILKCSEKFKVLDLP